MSNDRKEKAGNICKKRKLDSLEINQIRQDECIEKSLKNEFYSDTNFNKKFNNKENKRTFFDDSIISNSSPKINDRNSLTGSFRDKKRKNRFSFDGEFSVYDTNPKQIDTNKKYIINNSNSGLDEVSMKSKIKRNSFGKLLESDLLEHSSSSDWSPNEQINEHKKSRVPKSANYLIDVSNKSSKQAEINDETQNYYTQECEISNGFSITREKCKNSQKHNLSGESISAEMKLAKYPSDTNTLRMNLRRSARNKAKSPKKSSEEELSDAEIVEYEYEERKKIINELKNQEISRNLSEEELEDEESDDYDSVDISDNKSPKDLAPTDIICQRKDEKVAPSKTKSRKISSQLELQEQERVEYESDEICNIKIGSKAPAPRPRGRPRKNEASESRAISRKVNVEELLEESGRKYSPITKAICEPVSSPPKPRRGRPKKQQAINELKFTSRNDAKQTDNCVVEDFVESEIFTKHSRNKASISSTPRSRGRPKKKQEMVEPEPKFTPRNFAEQSNDSECEDSESEDSKITAMSKLRTETTVSPKPYTRGKHKKQPTKIEEPTFTSRNRAKQFVEIETKESSDDSCDIMTSPKSRSNKSVSSTPQYKGRSNKTQRRSELTLTPKKYQNIRNSDEIVESSSQSSDSEDCHFMETPKSSKKSVSSTPRSRKAKEQTKDEIVLPRRSLRLQEKAIKQAIENELKQNTPQSRTPHLRTPRSKSKTRHSATSSTRTTISKTSSASKKKENNRRSEKNSYSISPYVPSKTKACEQELKRLKKLKISDCDSDSDSEGNIETNEDSSMEEESHYTRKKIKSPVRKTRCSNRL